MRAKFVGGIGLVAISIAALAWQSNDPPHQQAQSAQPPQVQPAQPPQVNPPAPPRPQAVPHGGPPQLTPTSRPVTTGPAPKIELSAAEWDFGTLWEGEPVKTELIIKNAGVGPLKLNSVRGSCSCTVVQPSKMDLAPGESAPVPVSIDSTKRKGPVDVTVTIDSNDPAMPISHFRVKGMIKPIFDMKIVQTEGASPQPPQPMPTTAITFGRVSSDQQRTIKMEIANQGQQPANLEIAAPVENFDCKLTALEAGRKFELSVSTKPPLKAGHTQQTLKIKTGVDKFAELNIPITCLVMARVSVSPTVLNLPANIQRAMQRPVTVTFSVDKPIKITKLTVVGCDKITAEAMPPTTLPAVGARDGFDRHSLRVNLPAGLEIPEKGATLEIETDDKEFAKLTVPIARLPQRSPTIGVTTTRPGMPTTAAALRPPIQRPAPRQTAPQPLPQPATQPAAKP